MIGIIPTRMGTRGYLVHVVVTQEDHPHAYGDKCTRHHSSDPLPGSSPRVWGQASIGYSYKITGRIIPTRMGTRKQHCTFPSKAEDHPHAYGDKNLATDALICGQGSSPRVWGQDAFANTSTYKTRIIPTRMGTSYAFRQLVIILEDHPHAYGDKVCKGTHFQRRFGSSPRVWGQAYRHAISQRVFRIIPTRMGTRKKSLEDAGKDRDHPHAYGDKCRTKKSTL